MLHLAEQYIRRLVAVKAVPQTAHVTSTFLRRAASCRPISERSFLETMESRASALE
jgi:hypothetical protein